VEGHEEPGRPPAVTYRVQGKDRKRQGSELKGEVGEPGAHPQHFDDVGRTETGVLSALYGVVKKCGNDRGDDQTDVAEEPTTNTSEARSFPVVD